MLFSERYGYKKVKMLKKDEMPNYLRTRIWNIFHKNVFNSYINNNQGFNMKTGIFYLDHPQYPQDSYSTFITVLWDEFFKSNVGVIEHRKCTEVVEMIENFFGKLTWNDVYDFMEFFVSNFEDKYTVKNVSININTVLEEEKAPYRILKGEVIPLTSKEEIKEIEKALNVPDKFKSVREHLLKALSKWSDRKNPDYENLIKESICAVESLAEMLQGKKGTLGDLIKNLDIHPALKNGFKKLYGWTSDDSGIRHGEYGESFPCGEGEARYMLITCSAFVNYVIAKFDVGISNEQETKYYV